MGILLRQCLQNRSLKEKKTGIFRERKSVEHRAFFRKRHLRKHDVSFAKSDKLQPRGYYSSRAPVFSREKGFGGKSDWFSYKHGRSEELQNGKNAPAAKCPGRTKKANKASIPRYRQGKAGKKANKASVPRKLPLPNPYSLEKIDRGAGRIE
jgi:hypothetical protein